MHLVALVAAVALGQQGLPGFRELDLAHACEAARAESKLVFVDFRSAASQTCTRMDETTWPSPITQVWLQSNFVAVHVDVEADRAAATRYAVAETPTLLIANADGVEVDRITGFIAPMDLLERAKPMIRGAQRISAARALLAANPADPALHWELGRAFRRSRMDARALEQLLVAWDVGASVPAFREMRDTQLAFEIGVQAHNHKPSARIVERRCDELRERVRAAAPEGVDLVALAHDLGLLNDATGNARATVALRDELALRKPPPTAVIDALFTDGVARMLYMERRYDEMLAGRGDVLVYVDATAARIAAARREIDAERNTAADQVDEYEQTTFDSRASNIELGIAACVMYFEAVVGAGRSSDAKDMLETLLGLSSDGSTYARIIAACGRAGDLELGRAIGERAQRELTEKNELQLVRKAVQNLGAPARRF